VSSKIIEDIITYGKQPVPVIKSDKFIARTGKGIITKRIDAITPLKYEDYVRLSNINNGDILRITTEKDGILEGGINLIPFENLTLNKKGQYDETPLTEGHIFSVFIFGKFLSMINVKLWGGQQKYEGMTKQIVALNNGMPPEVVMTIGDKALRSKYFLPRDRNGRGRFVKNQYIFNNQSDVLRFSEPLRNVYETVRVKVEFIRYKGEFDFDKIKSSDIDTVNDGTLILRVPFDLNKRYIFKDNSEFREFYGKLMLSCDVVYQVKANWEWYHEVKFLLTDHPQVYANLNNFMMTAKTVALQKLISESAVVIIGLKGCGKSTFTKHFNAFNSGTHKICDSDDYGKFIFFLCRVMGITISMFDILDDDVKIPIVTNEEYLNHLIAFYTTEDELRDGIPSIFEINVKSWKELNNTLKEKYRFHDYYVKMLKHPLFGYRRFSNSFKAIYPSYKCIFFVHEMQSATLVLGEVIYYTKSIYDERYSIVYRDDLETERFLQEFYAMGNFSSHYVSYFDMVVAFKLPVIDW
jgi:hypothetical protein